MNFTEQLFFIPDMKLGMMDVGIFCKDTRFGINTEKGKNTAAGLPETVIPERLF